MVLPLIGAGAAAELLLTSSAAKLITQLAEKVWGQVQASAQPNEELEKLKLDTERQALEMKQADAAAKVAQELAIASRIENAEEVEIEEFYDFSANGQIGVSTKQEEFLMGVAASGQRVTKRVYRFGGKRRAAQTHAMDSETSIAEEVRQIRDQGLGR